MEDVRGYLERTGEGIYVVGLDNHVGFVAVRGDEMVFVHSSFFGEGRDVVAEPIDSHNPLRISNYRVFGKLFSDPF